MDEGDFDGHEEHEELDVVQEEQGAGPQAKRQRKEDNNRVSGKWTRREELIAEQLIRSFVSGKLTDCYEGCTLRSYLARKLQCAPMRVSKKFSGKNLGKLMYSPGGVDAQSMQMVAQALLEWEQARATPTAGLGHSVSVPNSTHLPTQGGTISSMVPSINRNLAAAAASIPIPKLDSDRVIISRYPQSVIPIQSVKTFPRHQEPPRPGLNRPLHSAPYLQTYTPFDHSNLASGTGLLPPSARLYLRYPAIPTAPPVIPTSHSQLVSKGYEMPPVLPVIPHNAAVVSRDDSAVIRNIPYVGTRADEPGVAWQMKEDPGFWSTIDHFDSSTNNSVDGRITPTPVEEEDIVLDDVNEDEYWRLAAQTLSTPTPSTSDSSSASSPPRTATTEKTPTIDSSHSFSEVVIDVSDNHED